MVPVLFVLENNQYSVCSPLGVRQPFQQNIANIVRGHGIPAETGDGQLIEEVYGTAGRMIEKIREGYGPSYVEFDTYRYLEHCGPNPDDTLGYRTQDEVNAWRMLS